MKGRKKKEGLRRKKEELRRPCLPDDRDKDCGQFVTFVSQELQFVRRDSSCIGK
jgi:hypothetical protein